MTTLSWIPRWVDESWTRVVQVTPAGDPLRRIPGVTPSFRCRQPHPQRWEQIAAGLEDAGERLRKVPIHRIVEAIGAATEPYRLSYGAPRREAVEELRAATGLSRETIHRSLDIEMNNYRPAELWGALRRELGDPYVLDEMRPDAVLRGFTRAIGPRLVGAVATGNIPGLSLLPIGRSLLVKAPILLKVARGEPTFAARIMQELDAIDPEVADAVVVTYWDSQDADSFQQAFRRAECLILFGSDDAVASVKRHVRPAQRVVVHGHRFSAAMLTRRYLGTQDLATVAERVATDVSTFDQHACIAPKTVVVEGGNAEADTFAAALAVALERQAKLWPPGDLSPLDAASIAARRATDEWREACGEARVWGGRGLAFTVVRTAEMPPLMAGGDRYITVVPAPSLEACTERLGVYGSHLQNVVVGADADELPRLVDRLSAAGACRVSPPGRGASPTMIWKHDGRACLAELVRWCDVEGLDWRQGDER